MFDYKCFVGLLFSSMRNAFIFILIFLPSYGLSKDLNFITLGVAPWAYFDDSNGEFLGVFPDLIREVEKRTDYSVKISLSPYAFARVNRELESGRQDCTMIIAGSKRQAISFKGELVFDLPMGIIARKGIKLKNNNLKNVHASILKVLSEREGFLDENTLIRQIDPTYEAGIKKLAHERVDAVVGAIPTLKHLAKKLGVIDLLGTPMILTNEPIYLQCSKNSKKSNYFETINEAIKEMKADGTLKKIADKYAWY
jgi:polar amino acid transport system substrate-binding protein